MLESHGPGTCSWNFFSSQTHSDPPTDRVDWNIKKHLAFRPAALGSGYGRHLLTGLLGSVLLPTLSSLYGCQRLPSELVRLSPMWDPPVASLSLQVKPGPTGVMKSYAICPVNSPTPQSPGMPKVLSDLLFSSLIPATESFFKTPDGPMLCLVKEFFNILSPPHSPEPFLRSSQILLSS